MESTILAIRAISSLYARRLLWPFLWVGIAVYALVMGLIGWVAYVASNWWWLLSIGPTLLLSIALMIWLTGYVLVRRIAPPMNKRQTKAAKKVIGHIDRVAEHVGTPPFIILFRIVRDSVTRPQSDRTFIGEWVREPGDIHHDFETLRRLF